MLPFSYELLSGFFVLKKIIIIIIIIFFNNIGSFELTAGE